MNLLQIKEKYKQILEEPESEQSDDEWELAYSQMKNKRRRHILTESSCINAPSLPIDDIAILKTKEKLAQALSTITKKDAQISELKSEGIKAQEHMRGLERQIEQLKQEAKQQQQRMIDQKVAYGCIQKSMESMSRNWEEGKMDKELLHRQVQFYRKEIESMKEKLNERDRKINEAQKSVRHSEKYKGINLKLKCDLQRMRQLLSETEKYKAFANHTEFKHYLGKPSREHECWFSQNVVEDVENFLRKHQLQSNKELALSLVSFVSRHIEEAKKKVEKRARKEASSRIKEIQRKHNHSLNFMEVREQTLKKSLLRTSMCKSRRTNTLQESKRCTESFIYDKLEKSLVSHEISHNWDLCCEMLNSFQKSIRELVEAKEPKRKKILKLVEWLVDGILSIFPREREGSGDFRLNTEQIKIVQ